MTYTRKYLLEGLKFQLSHDNQKASKALLILFDRQTVEEKDRRLTLNENKVGFTAYDADILTGVARSYISNGFLTTKQLELVKKKMKKYAGQILDYSISQGFIRQVSPRRYEIVPTVYVN